MLEIDNSRDSSISSLNIGMMLGDMTGTLHLRPSHKFYIEFDALLPKRSSPPCNFIVDASSELWLSHDFRLIGLADVAMQLNGHMSGVYNITLEDGRKMLLGLNSSNARYIEGKYVQSPPGGLLMSKRVYCVSFIKVKFFVTRPLHVLQGLSMYYLYKYKLNRNMLCVCV